MKSVVFDVGNVLLHWDPRIPFRNHLSTEAEITDLFDEIGLLEWNVTLDAGKEWDEGVREIIAQHPTREPEIRLFADDWHQTVSHAIDQSVEVLETLTGRGDAVYAITNFSALRWAECQARFPFLATFTDAVVSAHEKIVKPDPRIYNILLERNRLSASDCIFVDDSAANIKTAAALGFSTIHFSSRTKLANELSALGVQGLV